MNLSRQQLLIALVFILGALCAYLFVTRNKSPETPETLAIPSTGTSTTDTGTASASQGGQPKVPSAPNATGASTRASDQANAASTPALIGKPAPELVRPGGFSNTDPFQLKDFIGQKIVLVQFWTTSSEESKHTIPYLTDWYGKYKNYGLVIVGVHTPRFQFERSKTVVDDYAHTHNISYPLVIDNGAETWHAYKNNYWPHTYLIDMSGRVVYDRKGEGGYQVLEEKIQSLLKDRTAKLHTAAVPDTKLTTMTGTVLDPSQRVSAEGFFGADKNGNLANGTPRKQGVQTFDSLSEPKMNMSYLFGSWNISGESAANMTEHDSLIYRYHGKVATLLADAKTLRMKVLLDGKPLTQANAGKDIVFEKGESVIYPINTRLYEVVNDQAGYGDHSLELIPSTGGFTIYSLTFN